MWSLKYVLSLGFLGSCVVWWRKHSALGLQGPSAAPSFPLAFHAAAPSAPGDHITPHKSLVRTQEALAAEQLSRLSNVRLLHVKPFTALGSLLTNIVYKLREERTGFDVLPEPLTVFSWVTLPWRGVAELLLYTFHSNEQIMSLLH